MQSYPPQTENMEELAQFFDNTDTTELANLEELGEVPERDLVNVNVRLSRRDLEVLKRVAVQEGIPHSTFIRWLLHRFVRSLSSSRG